MGNGIMVREQDSGIDVFKNADGTVSVTTFIRSKDGGAETTIQIPSALWKSFAGTSLQMTKGGF